MATLGEILGGIVCDVVQARLLADSLACESAKAYATDQLLSAFPVPHVGLKDVTIKLRFAVDAVAEKDLRKEVEAEAQELWKRELATNIVPRAVGSSDPAALRAASEFLSSAKTPDFGLAAAMKGNHARMIRESKSFVVGTISRLPSEVRRKLGNVSAGITRELPAAVEAFILRARLLVNAKAAARTELQVLVRKADLENAKEQSIHEFTFTLALDDMHITGTGAGTPKGGP